MLQIFHPLNVIYSRFVTHFSIRWEYYHLLLYKGNLIFRNYVLTSISGTLILTMILKCYGMIFEGLAALTSCLWRRHILCCTQKNVELHGFCDSSGKACCAVVFVRVMCSHGVSVTLWMVKCRLAPVKKFSIVCLELLSCLQLSKLIKMVVKAVEVEVKVNKVFCWSDSQIAIWWICKIEKKWRCWIQNRVDTIRENVVVENWYYVPTKLNPTEISTRKTKLDKINKTF